MSMMPTCTLTCMGMLEIKRNSHGDAMHCNLQYSVSGWGLDKIKLINRFHCCKMIDNIHVNVHVPLAKTILHLFHYCMLYNLVL